MWLEFGVTSVCGPSLGYRNLAATMTVKIVMNILKSVVQHLETPFFQHKLVKIFCLLNL